MRVAALRESVDVEDRQRLEQFVGQCATPKVGAVGVDKSQQQAGSAIEPQTERFFLSKGWLPGNNCDP